MPDYMPPFRMVGNLSAINVRHSRLILVTIALALILIIPAGATTGHTWSPYVTCTDFACIPNLTEGDGNITMVGGIPQFTGVWISGTGADAMGIACTYQNWSTQQTHDYCSCSAGNCNTSNRGLWSCSVPPDCQVGDYLKIGAYFYGLTEWNNDANHAQWYINETGEIAPAASFVCSPTSQFPNTNVICTDSSTNTPTSWFWMVGINGQDESTWSTSTSQNYTWQKAYPALYSVKLFASNLAGGSWYNRTDYVSISNNATPNNCALPIASGYHRTSFQCTDSLNDAAISGCDIQLNDLEGGAWSNQSSVSSGVWCIDTLPNHHINGYSQATGYTSGSRLNVWESDGTTYTILLIPGYLPSPASGKVWVQVHVTDAQTGLNLQGAYVSISGSGQTTKSDTTGAAGTVSIQWPNATTAYINAVYPGYSTGIRVITTSNFGPDSVSIELHKGTASSTITPTPGPGGTVAPTIGPYGTPGASGTYAPGYVNNQGQVMMDFLAANGLQLVQLCFIVTILALLGVKLGK